MKGVKMQTKGTIQRVDFDPASFEHREALYTFIKEHRWTKHFNLYKPYLEIPHQCMMQTLEYFSTVDKG